LIGLHPFLAGIRLISAGFHPPSFVDWSLSWLPAFPWWLQDVPNLPWLFIMWVPFQWCTMK
jgi:hypothetical protein